MPYHIGEEGSHDCSGFPVVQSDSGKTVGCHKTKEEAEKHLRALYANVEDAKEKADKSMAVDMANAYASIIKQEKQEDGTLLVYGKATDDAIDSDNQICDSAWLEKAMPEWFKSGGNIREQHSNIAAGVAKELDSKADGHYITAHVVDPTSVKKVEAGVLKGFSIGIRSPRVVRDQKAANGRIIDGIIVEVSLVDRPANPNAKLMLAKSEGTEVIQVEELIETETPVAETVVEEAVVEAPVAEVADALDPVLDAIAETHADKSDEIAAAEAVVALAKSMDADTKKFDAVAFETARTALARLIQIEAKEMEEGSNESFSLHMLLCAVNDLLAWYEGEEAEGEVTEAEDAKLEGEEMDAEKSVTTIIPEPVTEPVTPIETEFVEEDSTEKAILADVDVNSIIEKAVQSAKDSVVQELELLKSAKEAVEAKVTTLEAELAKAKSLAVGTGPQRTIRKAAATEADANALRAAELLAKSKATTDALLAKGYKEMAEEFLAKSLA